MGFYENEEKPGKTDPSGVPSGSDLPYTDHFDNLGSTGYSGSSGNASREEGGDPSAGDLSQSAYTEDGRFLKNPLPVPKRRAHVRMEFDLVDDWDLPPEKDHFDLEISEDDDFDL